jgi:hypothetical protein
MESFKLKLTKYKALQEELICDVEKMFYDTCKLKLPEKCHLSFDLNRSYNDEGGYSDSVYMVVYYNDDSHKDIRLFNYDLSNQGSYVEDIIEDMKCQFEDEELILNKINEIHINELVEVIKELSEINDKYIDLIILACDLKIWGKYGGKYLRY